MKKYNFKKILSLITVFILSLSILCFGGCNTVKTEPTNSFKDFELKIDKINEFGISLETFDATLVEDEAGNYLKQTITATITGDPNYITNLDWSIEWVDLVDVVVSNEYLELKTSGAGNSVCDVICYKNFEEFGNAKITVTSSINSNVKASCIVEYLGIPEHIEVLNSKNNDISNTEISILEGETYLFDINSIHSLELGSNYGKEYDVTFELIGSLWLEETCKVYENETFSDEEPITFSLTVEEYNNLIDFDKSLLPEDMQTFEFTNFDKMEVNGGEVIDLYSLNSIFDYSSYLSFDFIDESKLQLTRKYLSYAQTNSQYSSLTTSYVYKTNVVSVKDLRIKMTITEKESSISSVVTLKLG